MWGWLPRPNHRETVLFIEKAWLRWAVAAAVLALVTWVNIYLQLLLEGRAPLLPYFPALVLVGLLCGLGPAFALLCGSCVAILYFWIAPYGEIFPIASFSDAGLIALFLSAGAAVALVAARVRKLMQADRHSRERLDLALDELRRDGERKDAFLATLAHELRNPMAAIRYAVEMLRRTSTAPNGRQSIDIIGRQAAHMGRLLDDLLDLSRITRNVVQLQRQTIDLRTVVRLAADAMGAVFTDRKHRLSVSVPASAVTVDGDATRLQQVLVNLLDNAAKYTPSPGTIAMELTVEGDNAQVTVQDNGVGIVPEMQAHVFDLFTRMDPGGSAPSGLGIGLAVTKQLVLLHGGQITVASDGAGHGSRFAVLLPLVDAPALTPSAAASGDEVPHAQKEQTSVLVVDDNTDAADMLAEVLRDANYEVSVAYSGEEALVRFEHVRPRVVLLDIGLPGISGTETARRLRQLAAPRSIVQIAITGWGQPADRDATAAAGFDAHLVKPVEFEEIERLIRRLAP